MIRSGAVSRHGRTVCDSPAGEAVSHSLMVLSWFSCLMFLMFLMFLMLCSLPTIVQYVHTYSSNAMGWR